MKEIGVAMLFRGMCSRWQGRAGRGMGKVRAVAGSEKGFTIIEALASITVLGLFGAALASGLITSTEATVIAKEKTAAESLARSQVEFIQHQPYDEVNNPPVYDIIPDLPASYSMVTPMAARLDRRGDGLDNDDGLQQITVTVQRGARTILTLVDYKVKR